MPEYRLNAGIVVFNKNGNVLLCRRKGSLNSWQFPQGGIDTGETPEEAAIRELEEETSLRGLQKIKTLDYGVRYDFPPEIAKKLRYDGKQYKGQEMYWSFFYFDGKDEDINLKTANPEFDAFRWTDMAEAYEIIVDFKKTAYKTALDEFNKILKTVSNL